MSGEGRKSNSSKKKIITVYLLDGSNIEIPVQHKTRYGDILIKVRKHLSLSSSNVFGLAYKTERGDYAFLDPLWKVWKKERMTNQSLDSNGKGRVIYLRVQYYANASHQFRSETDKQHYYLQLKENFLSYGFNYPDNRCFLLASYAIYSDEIQWREFDPRAYFPARVLKSYGTQFIKKHMPTIAPERMSPCQAMTTYINELSKSSPYNYNMTFYRLQSSKSDSAFTVRLGLCPEGLEIYEVDEAGLVNFLNGCTWSQINCIQAVKRKLVILVQSRRLEFYTDSEDWCRELSEIIKSCQELYQGVEEGTHRLHNDEHQSISCPAFRETYIYSDEHDLELEYEQHLMDTLRSSSTVKCDPEYVSTDDISLSDIYGSATKSDMATRFSIISTTSSTTTSGIVSDRTCLSTEASQEDLISSGTRPSSCDSLLDSEYEPSSETRSVTVQRTISEPSKNFEHLRFKTRRSPKSTPRRALSDETIDEHDYENIAIIRKVLGINSSVSEEPFKHPPNRMLPHRSKSQSSRTSAVNSYAHSNILSSISHHVSSISAPLPTQNRYSLISSSPSMEELLQAYTPPPSYNEMHAKQGEILLAASRQASEDSTRSTSSGFISPTSPQRSSPALNKSYAKKHTSTKQRSVSHKHPTGNTQITGTPSLLEKPTNCTCQKLSHPEIDKLRLDVRKDLVSLPMISALCNDKELLTTANKCTCLTKPRASRPISWHCHSNPISIFPSAPASKHTNQAQICR
ncbi:FERM domain-containing protein 6-like [Watersipora subatra]|uniref:FERM domain-containing protein 6-like n=1 Tax=Watersipora subatra TaxID=2589382 RepID=UPI00355B127A